MGNNALPKSKNANAGDHVKFGHILPVLYNVGNYVKLGRYPQTPEGEVHPVKWRVLAIENNKALVISRYGLDAMRFDSESNDWSKSEIRRWLNGEFYTGSFTVEEKACIKSFNQDNVFLLSDEEAEKYFANSDARKCNLTSYAKAQGAFEYEGYCYWWLRSPYPYNSDFVFSVNYYGEVNFYYDVCDNIGSVRPALWIDLDELNGLRGDLKESKNGIRFSESRKSSGPFKNANVDDYVEFGRYPQTAEGEVRPVEWQVLARENNKALVISRYALDARRFDESANNWDGSEIRRWLNGKFYTGSFTAEEKACIKSFNQDNVFLLSYEEAEKYFSDDDARKCKPTSYAKSEGAFEIDDFCYWWLRSPFPTDSCGVYYVLGGGVYSYGSSVSDASVSVRPALWINLDELKRLRGEQKKFKSRKSSGSNPFKNANVGNYVKFGRYPQTMEGEVRPVEWRVLAIENNKALVISRYGLDSKRFGSSNNWDGSEIRKWLNGEFYNSTFSIDEKARIKSFNQDNVFLLSYEETEKYFSDDDARKCKLTSYAKAEGAFEIDDFCFWWLRSSISNGSNRVYCVDCDGDVNNSNDVYGNRCSARPALWINLES